MRDSEIIVSAVNRAEEVEALVQRQHQRIAELESALNEKSLSTYSLEVETLYCRIAELKQALQSVRYFVAGACNCAYCSSCKKQAEHHLPAIDRVLKAVQC